MPTTSQHARIVARSETEWPTTPLSASTAAVWMPRLSPPIPSTWPVIAAGTVSTYCYAAARDPQLADGERVSAPWGRIDYLLHAPEQLQFSALPAGAAALGIQGVRPLTQADMALLVPDIHDRLAADLHLLADQAPSSADVAALMLQRYRLLFRLEAVVSRIYLKHHPALVQALAAPPSPL